MKRDCIQVTPLSDSKTAHGLIGGWIEEYNENNIHPGLNVRSSRALIVLHRNRLSVRDGSKTTTEQSQGEQSKEIFLLKEIHHTLNTRDPFNLQVKSASSDQWDNPTQAVLQTHRQTMTGHFASGKKEVQNPSSPKAPRRSPKVVYTVLIRHRHSVPVLSF